MVEQHGVLGSSLSALADGKLQRLLMGHPSPEVRDRFGPAIASGAIMISYTRIPSVDAAFATVPDPRAAVSIPRVLTPVLIVDPHSFVLGSHSDDWWTLVLFHESVHEWQFREGKIDRIVFEIGRRPRDAREAMHLAEEKWHAEREAYQEECKLAEQIGASRLLGPIAAVANSRGFEAALLAALVHAETDACARAYFQKQLRRARRLDPG